jgi:hypothetical protein
MMAMILALLFELCLSRYRLNAVKIFGVKHPFGAYDQIFIFVCSGFVDVGRTLW